MDFKGEDLELDYSRKLESPRCFKNIIQERANIPLVYPLQVRMLLSMILPYHQMTILGLILSYKILHL